MSETPAVKGFQPRRYEVSETQLGQGLQPIDLIHIPETAIEPFLIQLPTLALKYLNQLFNNMKSDILKY
jgi:hypothetical protein